MMILSVRRPTLREDLKEAAGDEERKSYGTVHAVSSEGVHHFSVSPWLVVTRVAPLKHAK